ncbi:SU10 major capsid protein [Shimia aestuarii]|uniref:Phage major capsid protein, HK97 family n=1 Tax=Shimia aestuarii TaxID=254406 RepID=A0A1I4HSL0_9RHOB|nr:DUF5309 family protein [Shimia aestuarii]SFL44767.1 hypothetical protein SAMN04488042_101234 [Shimia aestuarii]
MPNPSTHTDFSSVDFNGTIHEDVMNAIWDISDFPLPLMDMVGSGSADNHYHEWVEDALADPSVAWVADGADSDQDNTSLGVRLGNHTGIQTREVKVSQAAQDADSIGSIGSLGYQVMQRQKELRRNFEAAFLGIQGNVADSGDGVTPGNPAGLAAQLTQYDTGSGATGGGFSGGTWTAITPGSGVALTLTMIQDALEAAYNDGAQPSALMSVPAIIKNLSQYMFTSDSRIATLTRETQGVGKGGAAAAMSSVNVLISDFGMTIDFVPNRLQQTYTDTDGTPAPAAAVFLLDPSYLSIDWLTGFTVDPLAKTGLADKRLMHANGTICALNRDAGRVLLDIDPAQAVTT